MTWFLHLGGLPKQPCMVGCVVATIKKIFNGPKCIKILPVDGMLFDSLVHDILICTSRQTAWTLCHRMEELSSSDNKLPHHPATFLLSWVWAVGYSRRDGQKPWKGWQQRAIWQCMYSSMTMGMRVRTFACFVLFCQWYETRCWIQKAVTCCVCTHASIRACIHACIHTYMDSWRDAPFWFSTLLFISFRKRKLRITAGHLLDGYENLMRLAQDMGNLGGRAGLPRWKCLFSSAHHEGRWMWIRLDIRTYNYIYICNYVHVFV